MIGSVSSYSPYTSTSSTATSSARSQQFQKELLSKLDSNADGSVDHGNAWNLPRRGPAR